MLLYPAFGAAAQRYLKKQTGKAAKHDPKLEVFHGLGKTEAACIKKLDIFHSIFANNNRKQRESLFHDDHLIRELWPHMMQQLTFDLCFPKLPKLEVVRSFQEVTKIMEDEYKLPLPAWWVLEFPRP